MNGRRQMWLDPENEGGPPGWEQRLGEYLQDRASKQPTKTRELSWFRCRFLDPILDAFALILYVLGVGKWKRM